MHSLCEPLTNQLDIQEEPSNKITTAKLATLGFSTLFPDGKGDPTINATVKKISHSETDLFSQKRKHLV